MQYHTLSMQSSSAPYLELSESAMTQKKSNFGQDNSECHQVGFSVRCARFFGSKYQFSTSKYHIESAHGCMDKSTRNVHPARGSTAEYHAEVCLGSRTKTVERKAIESLAVQCLLSQSAGQSWTALHHNFYSSHTVSVCMWLIIHECIYIAGPGTF